MAAENQLRELLGAKFIIFDTNILIEALKHFDSFEVLLQSLKQYNCKILYFPLIELEFTRDGAMPALHKARLAFLKKIGGTSLPINDDIIHSAAEIARVYSHQRIAAKQISPVDCCIAAYLKKYHDKLFLITKDHKDFPRSIFDRIHIFAIDAEDDVLAPAVYRFNQARWASCHQKYLKAQQE